MLIDSSGARLVCALADGAEIVAEHSADPRGPDIGAAVAAVREGRSGAIDSIVVGIGPGSFIGTRTAISFANGYAAASGVPLYGVNSLAAIAVAGMREAAVLRDARRRQWYLWSPDGECTIGSEAGVVEILRAKGLREVIVEHPEGAAPPIAAVLNGAGFSVSSVATVPAIGLLKAAAKVEPQPFVEPVYLRGFT